MIAAWSKPGDKSLAKAVENWVDYFVCHPADNAWWREQLKDVANGQTLKDAYTLPALATQSAAPAHAAPAGVREHATIGH